MWKKCENQMKMLSFVGVLLALVLSGCVAVGGASQAPAPSEFQREVWTAMQDEIGKLSAERDFYCRVFNGWPVWNAWHWANWPHMERLGAVKPGSDPVEEVRLGDEIFDSLRRIRLEDAVSFGSISNRMVRTAGLAWIGKDGSSVAGLFIISMKDVYFVLTHMSLHTEPSIWLFRHDAPYYIWSNPAFVQMWQLKNTEEWVAFRDRLHEQVENRLRPWWGKPKFINEFFLDNYVTAFRLDIAPERIRSRNGDWRH